MDEHMTDEAVLKEHIRHLVNDALAVHMHSVVETMRRQEAAMIVSLTQAMHDEHARCTAAREPARPPRRVYRLFTAIVDVNAYCAEHPTAWVVHTMAHAAHHRGSVRRVAELGAADREQHEGATGYEVSYLVCEEMPCP